MYVQILVRIFRNIMGHSTINHVICNALNQVIYSRVRVVLVNCSLIFLEAHEERTDCESQMGTNLMNELVVLFEIRYLLI